MWSEVYFVSITHSIRNVRLVPCSFILYLLLCDTPRDYACNVSRLVDRICPMEEEVGLPLLIWGTVGREDDVEGGACRWRGCFGRVDVRVALVAVAVAIADIVCRGQR